LPSGLMSHGLKSTNDNTALPAQSGRGRSARYREGLLLPQSIQGSVLPKIDRQLLFTAGGRIAQNAAESELNSRTDR
jgi:hypothetical protein